MARDLCIFPSCDSASFSGSHDGFCFKHQKDLEFLLWILPHITKVELVPTEPKEQPHVSPLWTPDTGVPSGLVTKE